MKRWLTNLYLIPVFIYQKTLSRIMPPICRFQPTCSIYFVEAVRKKGILLGTCLGVGRVCKCHPFHPGGYDPVE